MKPIITLYLSLFSLLIASCNLIFPAYHIKGEWAGFNDESHYYFIEVENTDSAFLADIALKYPPKNPSDSKCYKSFAYFYNIGSAPTTIDKRTDLEVRMALEETPFIARTQTNFCGNEDPSFFFSR